MSDHRFDLASFIVRPGTKLDLERRPTIAGDEFEKKSEAKRHMEQDIVYLRSEQEKLYAQATQSLIVILQGMDAAGKDGCIEHVFGSINPQGCTVHSFKAPSDEDLQHHYLWRPMRYLPRRGMMAIFNRSYYEEVLVARVHPEFLQRQRLPSQTPLAELWEHRFEEIRQFEAMLHSHGTRVVKFFLHISPEEQLERLLARLETPEKHWKFNMGDLEERELWTEYQHALEEALAATSTSDCPWYVVPSDSKWYARAFVADAIAQTLENMAVAFPTVPAATASEYQRLAQQLRQGSGSPI